MHFVLSAVADQDVRPVVAQDEVRIVAADDVVVAGRSTFSSWGGKMAIRTPHQIPQGIRGIFVVGFPLIRDRVAKQFVVAGAALDMIVAVAAADRIVAPLAFEYVLAVVTI